jgi:hypothetical protein
MESWDLKRSHLDSELRQAILAVETGPKEAAIQKIEKLIYENKSGDSTSSGFRKS